MEWEDLILLVRFLTGLIDGRMRQYFHGVQKVSHIKSVLFFHLFIPHSHRSVIPLKGKKGLMKLLE